MTATHLLRRADALGRHLPLRDPQLETAGRLLTWLRRLSASDNPAQLVLCERVIEQVCGWAGVSQPPRFVHDYLRPDWVYQQVRSEVSNCYWAFWSEVHGQHPLRDQIETTHGGQSAGGAHLLPSINLRRVLELLDELVDLALAGSPANVRLARLQARAGDRAMMGAWLDELFGEFDRRNARLRRTRNALMHGGPIVTGTVDNVSQFAVALAHYTLGRAVDLLLDGRDVVDGFLDEQQQQHRCIAQLREGRPPSEVLFLASPARPAS